MKIASILENQNIEKRIAITPEIAKKYISLGIEVSLCKNYAKHLGINDDEYIEFGVSILNDEKEIINNTDVIVQLGLLDDNKSALLKENQTFIGVLNPYNNKDKIKDLVKKNINTFSKSSKFFALVKAYGDKFLSCPLFPKEAEVAEYINLILFFKQKSNTACEPIELD